MTGAQRTRAQRTGAQRTGAPTADWSRATGLRGIELLACWGALELGEPPLELELRPPGGTVAERDRALAGARDELARRGLLTPAGPDLSLARALRLLATGPRQLDLRLSNGLVALGASDREQGVVLVRAGVRAGTGSGGTDQTLYLLTVPGPRVAATLIELIGPLTAGRARPVNLTAEVLDDARRSVRDGSYWTLADQLVSRGVDRADAHSFARMCTGITANGQLGALARTGETGRRVEHRGGWVVGFHRGAEGDFLQLRRPTGPRGATVTVAPISADRLLAKVQELVAALPA